jgi:hypothetical protein
MKGLQHLGMFHSASPVGLQVMKLPAAGGTEGQAVSQKIAEKSNNH